MYGKKKQRIAILCHCRVMGAVGEGGGDYVVCLKQPAPLERLFRASDVNR